MKDKENMTYGEYVDRKKIRQSIFTAILLIILGAFIGLFIMGSCYASLRQEYTKLEHEKEIYEEYADIYEDLLDMAGERIDELEDEKSELKGLLDKALTINPPVQEELHESYKECLHEIMNEYSSKSKLKYCINQVSIIHQADDIIYQFIIVIYDDNFNFIDTWNCYAVYDGEEFMYIDCDLVE